jgi:hypothetical protein
VVILINEYVDGIESPDAKVRAMLEKEFMSKNFKLVDKEQLMAVKTRDVSVSYEDPQKAAVLGARLGAEVVITGSANAEFMEKSKPYGVSVFAYSSDVNVKAVKTDTAEVIAVASANATKRAGGKSMAANEALSDCGKQLADKMIKDITEKWRGELYNYVDILLFISAVDPAARTKLLADLKEVRGVKDIYEKSYTNNVVEIDLKIEGAAAKTIDSLITEKAAYLQLRSKTANRLDFEVVKGAGAAVQPASAGKVINAAEPEVQEQPEAVQASETIAAEEAVPEQETQAQEAVSQETAEDQAEQAVPEEAQPEAQPESGEQPETQEEVTL